MSDPASPGEGPGHGRWRSARTRSRSGAGSSSSLWCRRAADDAAARRRRAQAAPAGAAGRLRPARGGSSAVADGGAAPCSAHQRSAWRRGGDAVPTGTACRAGGTDQPSHGSGGSGRPTRCLSPGWQPGEGSSAAVTYSRARASPIGPAPAAVAETPAGPIPAEPSPVPPAPPPAPALPVPLPSLVPTTLPAAASPPAPPPDQAAMPALPSLPSASPVPERPTPRPTPAPHPAVELRGPLQATARTSPRHPEPSLVARPRAVARHAAAAGDEATPYPSNAPPAPEVALRAPVAHAATAAPAPDAAAMAAAGGSLARGAVSLAAGAHDLSGRRPPRRRAGAGGRALHRGPRGAGAGGGAGRQLRLRQPGPGGAGDAARRPPAALSRMGMAQAQTSPSTVPSPLHACGSEALRPRSTTWLCRRKCTGRTKAQRFLSLGKILFSFPPPPAKRHGTLGPSPRPAASRPCGTASAQTPSASTVEPRRRKPAPLGGAHQRLPDLVLVQLRHLVAARADQELHRVVVRVVLLVLDAVHAADEGGDALHLVDQPLLQQEVEGAVHGGRGGAAMVLAQTGPACRRRRTGRGLSSTRPRTWRRSIGQARMPRRPQIASARSSSAMVCRREARRGHPATSRSSAVII